MRPPARVSVKRERLERAHQTGGHAESTAGDPAIPASVRGR
jgi:hypothetical protein